MDYSTISNKTNCTEIEDISYGELSERYHSLRKQHENLSSNFEATKQELHDTRRSYQTALDVQRHITAELESYQADEARRRNELNARIQSLQEEISALREERTEITERYGAEIKQLEVENRRLKEENSCKVVRESPERDNSELEEARTATAAAMAEAAEAKVAVEEARSEMMLWRLKAEELAGEVTEMRQVVEGRREELRAVAEREESALADLAEARAMLHQFTDSQDLQPHAAKGNSIFAEVEDKRQEMAKTLIQMKQTNARLRRDLANKQTELEALLHEKQTIWMQQAGAAAHYDRELIESYEERITQLEALCERQRRELARWFNKLCEPTAQGWLPGVLEHLKTECEQLRAEVLSYGAAQLANAAQVRELRRKLAHLTANGAKLTNSPTSQNDTQPIDNKAEISLMRPIEIRSKSTVEDVKKKVSFN